MSKMIDKTKETFKEQVQKIEREILALTDNATARLFSENKGAYLVSLINERKEILDAMFQATPDEVRRMYKLNDKVKVITRQMYERVAIANEDATKVFGNDNFEVEGCLNYNPNDACATLSMTNDDYYGSDFVKIHKVMDRLFEQGFLPVKCADFVRVSDLANDLDNCETGYEDWQPQAKKFKHINICFAIHSLNAYPPLFNPRYPANE